MSEKGLFVGLIPDGGRRAVDNELQRFFESYDRGGEVVGDVLKLMVRDERVRIFTAWGLSDDNAQKRSALEIDILNRIFTKFLKRLRCDLATPEYEQVGVVHMGNRDLLDKQVMDLVDEVTTLTVKRRDKIFGLCLAYGSEDEMLRAEKISRERWKNGDENTTMFDCLDLPLRGNVPFQPVDLIARTGTDPLDPYTSAYLLPYQIRGGTRERYVPEYLPEFEPQKIIGMIDDVESRAKRKGK